MNVVAANTVLVLDVFNGTDGHGMILRIGLVPDQLLMTMVIGQSFMVNGLVAVDRDSPGANWGFSLFELPEKFIRYAVLFSVELTDALSGCRHEKQPFLKLVQTFSHFRRFD